MARMFRTGGGQVLRFAGKSISVSSRTSARGGQGEEQRS